MGSSFVSGSSQHENAQQEGGGRLPRAGSLGHLFLSQTRSHVQPLTESLLTPYLRRASPSSEVFGVQGAVLPLA